MEKGDDTAAPNRLRPANDNEPESDLSGRSVEAALSHIAQAIGRHIARQHIRARKAANDNDPGPPLRPPEP
ncbi:hypothetical protein GS397_13530 [Sphingobium yanoikuyae]|uniref:Uncharacterized protein n=1 Tax=Sphingobium yanoikuyae TaxID=13690 RepID=A0A6P1GHP9_SPHYA|nr:hypothetical protein [Sphingobium yanoikuyae]QHD67958.1 hypothetical protein GS397_13530 [Sphingobium yanoikuyae]